MKYYAGDESGVLTLWPGEDPRVAHERLTREVFFPVRLQKIYFRNCTEDAVDEKLYEEMNYKELIGIESHLGVLDVERKKMLSVVTRDNYELVTNQEVCEFVLKRVIPEVFKTGSRFLCNQVIMPESRGSCYMDLCCVDYEPPIKFHDVWQPFMRVTNSYNKTKKMSCTMGFCKRGSDNRIIFGDRQIAFTSVHNRGIKLRFDRHLAKCNDPEQFALSFYRNLATLYKYYFPRNMMLALLCKVFEMDTRIASSRNSAENKWLFTKTAIELIEEFFGQNGDNAYAAFCVLTAYASHPIKRFGPGADINKLQSMVGEWVKEFPLKVMEDGFNFRDYLTEETWDEAESLSRAYVKREWEDFGRIPSKLVAQYLMED